MINIKESLAEETLDNCGAHPDEFISLSSCSWDCSGLLSEHHCQAFSTDQDWKLHHSGGRERLWDQRYCVSSHHFYNIYTYWLGKWKLNVHSLFNFCSSKVNESGWMYFFLQLCSLQPNLTSLYLFCSFSFHTKGGRIVCVVHPEDPRTEAKWVKSHINYLNSKKAAQWWGNYKMLCMNPS